MIKVLTKNESTIGPAKADFWSKTVCKLEGCNPMQTIIALFHKTSR